jgi:hypothetical protein
MRVRAELHHEAVRLLSAESRRLIFYSLNFCVGP